MKHLKLVKAAFISIFLTLALWVLPFIFASLSHISVVWGGYIYLVAFIAPLAAIPLPIAIIWDILKPNKSSWFGFMLSMILGLLPLYGLLLLIETDPVTVRGNATIYIHAGPTLNASTRALSYITALPFMLTSLGFYYLLRTNPEIDKKL